jgi:tyrosinase
LDVNNVKASPVFDGSATSLSGDGAPVPHGPLVLGQPFNPNVAITLPSGQGGGCLTSGPFKDMITHLGPIALPVPGSTNTTGVEGDWLQDNPRCVKRDLNSVAIARYSSFRNTTDLILQNPTVELFQAVMQADPRYVGPELGVHGGGHFAIGGNPGGDVFVSPGDPAFYLHHAQIDRVYWIWQLLDYNNRKGVFGTGTILDTPPSPNVTVNDYIDLSPLNGPVQIKNLMNTVAGSPLCYVYL